jgi:hypothetical protein
MSPGKTTAASHPFHHADADLILRSSDQEPVDFRIFKLLLSLASPFFSLIFTLPQPKIAKEVQDGIPVIHMAEDKQTLKTLLGFCYPISMHAPPQFESLSELQKVADAAFKYEMEGIQRHARKELIEPRFVESQPLRVFAIAHRYGWAAEVRLAAKNTLQMPKDHPFVAELAYISAAIYHRLQEYRRVCGEVASTRAALQPALLDQEDDWVWVTCQTCPKADADDSFYPAMRKWWTDWIHDTGEELLNRPRGETVKKYDVKRKALAKADSCLTCRTRAPEELDAFSQMLAVQIENEISAVGSPILIWLTVPDDSCEYTRFPLGLTLMIGIEGAASLSRKPIQ